MHSSAAPASSAASRGTSNTAELSTTRNGRNLFPPPSDEYRMASISRFGRAISSGSRSSDNNFPSRASVSSAVRSSRLAKSIDAVMVVIKRGSGSSRADHRSWHRLRQFHVPACKAPVRAPDAAQRAILHGVVRLQSRGRHERLWLVRSRLLAERHEECRTASGTRQNCRCLEKRNDIPDTSGTADFSEL